MSRVRVVSAVKIKDMSRVRVESRCSSFESELSQLDAAWVKVESMIFRGENVKISQLSVICNFTGKEPTYSYIRPHPPPRSTTFPKLGKMWWVVSHIWLNSDSNELSQRWVRLVNLGFELSRSWVRLANLGFELSRSWVRLANLGFELSRSWVTWIVIWVRVESARENESSTTLSNTSVTLPEKHVKHASESKNVRGSGLPQLPLTSSTHWLFFQKVWWPYHLRRTMWPAGMIIPWFGGIVARAIKAPLVNFEDIGLKFCRIFLSPYDFGSERKEVAPSGFRFIRHCLLPPIPFKIRPVARPKSQRVQNHLQWSP